MTALTPDEVTHLVAGIADLLTRGVRAGGGGSGVKQRRESLDQAYRWLYCDAYGLAGGEPPTARPCPNCGGTNWTYDADREPRWKRCDECEPTSHGDPTGDTTAARIQRQMAVVAAISGHLEEARSRVLRAVALIRTETERRDDTAPTPRTESRAGVAEAQAAQGRRTARGEGWGES